jgi:hypothetical protein
VRGNQLHFSPITLTAGFLHVRRPTPQFSALSHNPTLDNRDRFQFLHLPLCSASSKFTSYFAGGSKLYQGLWTRERIDPTTLFLYKGVRLKDELTMATIPAFSGTSNQSKNILRVGVIGLGEIAQACYLPNNMQLYNSNQLLS